MVKDKKTEKRIKTRSNAEMAQVSPQALSVQDREITQEIQKSYLEYAMSVIVSRALPDVRDGLKPVHRRILWAMWENGNSAGSKFKKSANTVGYVMGRYHPHGDTAIYDSLVRMAQDFSLRYPLVQGQGNFGCFTKDTKIKLTDGRDLSFGDLVGEWQAGKKNYTYTVNKMDLISIAEIKHPRKTIDNAELIKVTLDNDQEIRCTPNHRFMLKDRSYEEAQYLCAGDSLAPFYYRLSEKQDRLQREGYILVHQPKSDTWVPAHHLADNYNLTHGLYKKSDGRVRHHVDFNKLNNNPDNIKRLGWGEHWKVHYTQASEQHKKPEYREKIAAGRMAYWADERNRDKKSHEVSGRNRRNWQKPEYREKMRVFLSEINKQYIREHPEKRDEFSIRATKTLKRLWKDPVYQALFREKIIKGNKNHTTNHTGKLKFLNICRELLKQSTIITAKKYEAMRPVIYPYGHAPLWDTGLEKYFQNNPELVRQELNQNHKVVKVERLAEREDVYDLTIDGTHNFALSAGVFVHNSIDGDNAAAMRYTEARLARISDELLNDIEKETVNWRPNYDESAKEPVVLPSRLPNLLINGSMGIAVGMATSIPPHNLGEVIDATLHLIENPEADVKDLMQFVKGPDFPTAGFIYNERDILNAYATGRGPLVMRGKAEIVEGKSSRGGGFQIVITEIPYQVNKSELIIKIADLVKEKKLDGIRDLRDESDREGMRIVVDLKQDAFPKKVLNQLFKYTELQKAFHFNMLALIDGVQPQILGLKGLLEQFIKHRREVVVRRSQFELRRAKERAHILEGLKKALDHIDEIIKIIKKSESRQDASVNLIKRFKFSDLQTNAILEMKLQALAGLERRKIEDELKEKKSLIEHLEDLLASPKKILGVVKSECLQTREKYADERRTKVVKGPLREIGDEELMPEEDSLFMITLGGYIKRLAPEDLRAQKRGGKGLTGITTKEEDIVEQMFMANTHDNILFFTHSGKAFQTKGYEVPESSRQAKGKAIVNFLQIAPTDRITAVVPIPKDKKGAMFLFMTTANGVIKKLAIDAFEQVRRNGIIVISLNGNDELKWVLPTSGEDEIVMTTSDGSAIRFKEKDVRPMGRGAAGVIGIRPEKDAKVVGADVVPGGQEKGLRLLVVMENGYGKRTDLSAYKTQKRGGKGVMTAKITPKTGRLVSAHITSEENKEFVVISKKGQVIRTSVASVSVLSRATQGVRVMRLESGDTLASVVLV